jgi:predicted dienelactone hydrolase
MSLNRRKTIASLLCTAVPGLPVLAQETRAVVVDETWLDATRQREVPVKLRWPDASVHPGQRPVVLFSHGLGGTREGGSVWGETWAAAGFVVLHVQHAGSDLAAVRRVASSFSDQAGLRAAGGAPQLQARLGDVAFALDEMGRRHTANQGRWDSARITQVGMAGHSFGALTTLGIAGQRYPGFEGVNELRLASFIALSPSMPASGDPAQAFERLTRPLLSVTGTRDGDVAGTGATPERRAAVFAALPPGTVTGNKAHLVLKDADHMTFGGQTGRAAEIVRREAITRELQGAHHALVSAITTDWWRATLLADAAALSRLSGPVNLGAGDRWQHK